MSTERTSDNETAPSESSKTLKNPSSSTVIRFTSIANEPESLEDFDFDRPPSCLHKPDSEASAANESIPYSSGMTALSTLTLDDSALLIKRQSGSDPKLETDKAEDLQQPTVTVPSQEQQQDKLTELTARQLASSAMDQTAKNQPNQSRRKNYQVFPGQNKFFCGGRLMTSSEYWAFGISLLLLIAPCVLFAVFTCPFLWYNVHVAVPIIFGYLFLLSLISMIKTSWTDPGIIPRGLDPLPDTFLVQTDNASDIPSAWDIPLAANRNVQIKDQTWPLKYCDTCQVYRPPRASHCRQCNNCVENEDHHCIWLNNCIGSRNYRSFFTFITTSTILCLYVIAFSIIHLLFVARSNGGIGQVPFVQVLRAAPVSFVLALLCFVLLTLVGGLTMYHCLLVMRGITTHEQLRFSTWEAKQDGLGANPFNKHHLVLNMIQVLCAPQPKSHLRRRKYVDPEATMENTYSKYNNSTAVA